MDHRATEALLQIVGRYGTSVLEEPRRAVNLLRDMVPELKREVAALEAALRLRAAMGDAGPSELGSERLLAKLSSETAIGEREARWAVAAVAALGGTESVSGAGTGPLSDVPTQPAERGRPISPPAKAANPPLVIVGLLCLVALLLGALGGVWLSTPPAKVTDEGKPKGPPEDGPKEKRAPLEKKEQTPEWFTAESVGMKFRLVRRGKFMMGSAETEKDRSPSEGPQHEVEITRDFYVGVYEVTQGEWKAVMGDNPSWFSATKGGRDKVEGLDTTRFPVETISWEDARTFLEKLNATERKRNSGWAYRFPTEAEWEYACRGGGTAKGSSVFHFGDKLSSRHANFNGDFPYGGADKGPFLWRTCKVGSYEPNALGLYDMHGNVAEWCEDRYDKKAYRAEGRRDPFGPEKGLGRMVRGGNWVSFAANCRSACRNWSEPSDRYDYLGLRLAAVPSGKD